MTRYVWDRDKRRFIQADKYYAAHPPKRVDFHIINDETDAFKSMVDGKHYTSKSRYRRALRGQGVVEIGNDRVPNRRPEPESAVPDIVRAMGE